MPTTENKVKFGLKNVHYATMSVSDTGDVTFGTPVAIPGAVNLSLKANGSPENFYADNGVYYIINNNAGYTGDLEIAKIPESFSKDCLGETEDTNMLIAENATAQLKFFALMFEFDGDVNKIRHVFYKCAASRPDVEGATITDKISVKTDKLSLTCVPMDDGYVKARTSANTTSTVYDAWYTKVTLPNATA